MIFFPLETDDNLGERQLFLPQVRSLNIVSPAPHRGHKHFNFTFKKLMIIFS